MFLDAIIHGTAFFNFPLGCSLLVNRICNEFLCVYFVSSCLVEFVSQILIFVGI